VSKIEIRIPDIGDAKDVSVVEVQIQAGATIAKEDPIVTLETDKASMDVPSPVAGVVASVSIKKGDKVSAGTLVATVEAENAAPPEATAKAEKPVAAAPPPAGMNAEKASSAASSAPSASPPVAAASAAPKASAEPTPAAPIAPDIPAGALDLVVIGAGPGGYTAAFRAADLGLKVTLIERYPVLGGVCLNVGCIPSKALLHAAKVIEDAESMAANGIEFGAPKLDLDKLRAWKSRVVGRLTGGLATLAKQRKVDVLTGEAKLIGPYSLELKSGSDSRTVHFKQCIIAAGSESVRLPGLPDDPRIIDSTGALELPADCRRLLVIGGGIIGLEMACVYDALGVKVSVMELSNTLMPGCDPDLVRPLQKRIEKRYEKIMLGTKAKSIEARKEGLRVTFEGPGELPTQDYDRVLVAVGRSANGRAVGAAAAGVKVSERGIIAVDKQMRTNVPHIFAIGDIAGAPMLAHKATHEAKVAAEVAAGLKAAFDARCIPSVAYTDPEIAWVGVTESDAKAQGLDFGKGTFPWAASGRSLALNRDDGSTKLLFDAKSHRVVGAGIVGPNAGDLIAEVGLAIEMGADAADIGLTIHPHPTLSETVAFAAEAFEGTLTDLYIPKKSSRA
jgi:dihydrolipoamide dehydrogenase